VVVFIRAFRHVALAMTVPRTVVTPHLMGRTVGPPGDRRRQREVVDAALRLLADADAVGTVRELDCPRSSAAEEQPSLAGSRSGKGAAMLHVWITRTALLLALGMLAAACATAAPDGDGQDGPTAANGEAAASDDDSDPPSGDPPPWPWELAAQGVDVPATVPLEEIRSGGPPPDGIPPIDDPVFETVDEADEWLEPQDPVMLVQFGGDARAYPLAILTFHEIVNDVVDGAPVVVTYCPLCNSGLVFERTLDGEVLDFGTSGRLWRSNLVMYDRATRSLWSQFTGEAIVGERLGDTLPRLPMQIVSWDEYRATWPDGRSLSRDTGHSRPYGDNPYTGYDTASRPFLFDGETGGPLPQMARVVTTGGEDDPVAYTWDALTERRVVHDEVAGEPAVVFWAPGTASALDERSISDSRDVGATGVFRPVVDSEELTFEPEGQERFRDAETGSTWNVLGQAVDGPLEGHELERFNHDDTFWFVQFAFRPDTRIGDPT
jgi:hypothetical protein